MLGKKSTSYLNSQFGSRKGIHTRVIESPGLWMNESELKDLVRDLRAVVATMNFGDLEYGIFVGSKDSLDRGVITIIYDGNSKPIAFNSMTFIPCELHGQPTSILHLGLIVVDPNVRQKGMLWTLYGLSLALLLIKNRLRPFWISSVTQVPIVFGKVQDSFSDVFPSSQSTARRSYSHLQLARQIMKHHRHVFGVGPEAGFDEDRFVITNAYTGGSDHLKKTYEKSGHFRDPSVNEYLRTNLDYDRGDDFIQIGRADLFPMFSYLRHMLPANRIFEFLVSATIVTLESWIAPMMQWFASGKKYKELRPR